MENQRFELLIGQEPSAFLSYARQANRVTLEHTFVPSELRGRGLAAELTRSALAEARRRGWKVIARCSYVAAFIEQHPEFADLLDGQSGAKGN